MQTHSQSVTRLLKAAVAGVGGTFFISVGAHAGDYYNAAATITYKGSNPYAGQAYAPQGHAYQPAAPAPYKVPVAPQPRMPQQAMPQAAQPMPAPHMPKVGPTPVPHASLPHGAVPRPAPMKATPGFDPRTVDVTLYKHQRVGKPYTIGGKTYHPKHEPRYDVKGEASWYGQKFHGKLTANGEKYDKNALTAAHKTLPMNSYVWVTNLENGRALKLRINDRGPFIGNRIIDLSEAAAGMLGIAQKGLGQVRVQYAGPAQPMAGLAVPVQPQATPQNQAQAARPVTPQVTQPLRRGAQAVPPQARRPERSPQTYAEMPNGRVPSIMAPAPAFGSPDLRNMPPIPQAYAPAQQGDDTVVTLTIKGPIHMAGHKSSSLQPRFIKGRNERVYKTIK